MTQSVENRPASVKNTAERTGEAGKDSHTHFKRTREDVVWHLTTIINPHEKLSVALKKPVLGKGWEVNCTTPGRCPPSLAA